MAIEALAGWVASCLLLSLRIAPAFALAPPFTLVRFPVLFRVFFGIGLAVCLVSAYPAVASRTDLTFSSLAGASARELLLGSIFVLAFQVAYGALYMAGRVIDIQAGFGLAVLIDPTTRGQTPLVGTLFAYAAGAVFFALDGHHDLLKILASSLEAIPLGSADFPTSLAPLTRYMSVVFVTALGVGGGTIVSLFLADLAIAALSRTAPQMNALVLGFQLKTLILLLALPLSLGASAALFARMTAVTLEAIPRLL